MKHLAPYTNFRVQYRGGRVPQMDTHRGTLVLSYSSLYQISQSNGIL